LGSFFPSLFAHGYQKKTILNMGSHMNRFAALLLATTAISAATPGNADGYDASLDQNEPFFWTDINEDQGAQSASAPVAVPDATPVAAPVAASGNQTATPTGGLKDAPIMTGSAGDPRDTPPRNPIQEAYPEKDSPQYQVPSNGTARYLDDECSTSGNAPYSMQWSRNHDAADTSTRANVDPTLRRRGEMAGDDGVLEAIQDNPCTLIYRRGGETAASANEYTHPDDIRRVNTLEDRRIPVHEIGRYATEESTIWHRDPDNPFVDASQKWTVERGILLSEMLTAWGEEAGYNVVWRSPYDYVVETDVVINGTFPEASGKVLESYKNANPGLAGDLYLSQHVLVVNTSSEFDGR
jgi:hypothetical protein